MKMAGRKKKFTHPRLMTVDPNFIPCGTQENDEIFLNGIFRFNISHMLADIESGLLQAVPVQIDVIKWYKEHVERYGEPPLTRILEEENRIIFEDSNAASYLYVRDENATPISYQIERGSNKMAFVYTLESSREVIANFMPDPNLVYQIDGQPLLAQVLEDQIILTLPSGFHRLEIRYVDYDFNTGLFFALSMSLILFVLWWIMYRHSLSARLIRTTMACACIARARKRSKIGVDHSPIIKDGPAAANRPHQ